MFSEIKKKKGNLFLRFWLILFSEKKKKKKRILFSEREKNISFVLTILLFLFWKKKRKKNFTKPNKQVVCWFTKKEIPVQSTRKGFEP